MGSLTGALFWGDDAFMQLSKWLLIMLFTTEVLQIGQSTGVWAMLVVASTFTDWLLACCSSTLIFGNLEGVFSFVPITRLFLLGLPGVGSSVFDWRKNFLMLKKDLMISSRMWLAFSIRSDSSVLQIGQQFCNVQCLRMQKEQTAK